jgi:hypothetical protein
MSDDMFPFEEKANYALFENRICLAVIAANGGTPKFLVTKEGDTISLPYKSLLKGQRSLNTAKQIFEQLTGMSPEPWVLIQQTGFVDTQDEFQIVLYSVMIPECIPMKSSAYEWMAFDELIHNHLECGEKRPTALDLFSYASHASKLGST